MTTSLGLRGQTVASLQAFKARNDNAKRRVQQLSELPTTVDFSAYRSVLKNQAVIDEIEKRFTAFKPVSYDVSRQLKAIDTFAAEAVKNAEATKEKVDLELQDLQKTLKNIEEARSFEELTVVCLQRRTATRTGVCDGLGDMLMNCYYRTRLLLLSLPSTRRLPSWSPGVVGASRDTRCVSFWSQISSKPTLANGCDYRKNSAISQFCRQHDGPLPFVYFSILDIRIGGTEELNRTVARASKNPKNPVPHLDILLMPPVTVFLHHRNPLTSH